MLTRKEMLAGLLALPALAATSETPVEPPQDAQASEWNDLSSPEWAALKDEDFGNLLIRIDGRTVRPLSYRMIIHEIKPQRSTKGQYAGTLWRRKVPQAFHVLGVDKKQYWLENGVWEEI